MFFRSSMRTFGIAALLALVSLLSSCGGGERAPAGTLAQQPDDASAHSETGLASHLHGLDALPCAVFGPGCGNTGDSSASVFWLKGKTADEPLTLGVPIQTNVMKAAPSMSGSSLQFRFDGYSVAFTEPAADTGFAITGVIQGAQYPPVAPFAPGFVRRAQMWVFAPPGVALLDVERTEFLCDSEPLAAYVIHDATFASDGTVQSFAADFMLDCGGGKPAKGAVRYHSNVPPVLHRLFANAGPAISVGEGRSITLDASRSWSPDSSIVDAAWSQVSGPPLDLTGCRGMVCNTYSPLLPGGSATAVMRITVRTDSGLVATDDLQIDIQSNASTKNLVEFSGAGFLAGFRDYSVGPKNGHVIPYKQQGTEATGPDQSAQRLHVGFAGLSPTGDLVDADFQVESLTGEALTPGDFPFLVGASNTVRFSVGNNQLGRGCGLVGMAVIGDIDRDPADYAQIHSLSAFLTAYCDPLLIVEPDPSYVRIWINHTPGTRPTASLSAPSTVAAGDMLRLSSKSSTSARPLAGIIWRQIAGPPLQAYLSDYDTVVSASVPPDAPAGTRYVYAVDVVDSAAESDTAIAVITVR